MQKSFWVILFCVWLGAAVGGTFYLLWSRNGRPPNETFQSSGPLSGSLALSENEITSTQVYSKPAENQISKFPIFNYHHIGPLPPEADAARRAFTVTPEIFEQQLKYLKENGYEAVLVERLVDYFETGRPLPQKAVALTFDDGRPGQYLYALPLLKKYNTLATFFIITDWVGQKDILSWEQIKEMQEAGMAIGSHTISHPHLAELSDEQLKKELEESKKIIEEKIGRPVDLLAYPGGNYDERVIEAVKNAGYVAAFGVYKIINQMPKYRYAIRRFHADDDLNSITSKLTEY